MDNMEKSVSKVIAKSMLEEEGKCSIIDTNKAQRRTGDHGVTQPTDYAGGSGIDSRPMSYSSSVHNILTLWLVRRRVLHI